ncbi:MAG: hypothetical protein Q9223_007557 [Gallowayella weberi]
MTLDRQNKIPNLRATATSCSPKWTSRSTPTPSNVQSPTSAAAPKLRKDDQGASQNVSATGGEEVATPLRSFLGSNITPRSGSRKARVESASSTPRRTPESASRTGRPLSMIEGRDWPSGELKKAPASGTRAGHVLRPARAQSVCSDVQYPVGYNSPAVHQDKASRAASPDSLPKFFHANDAKPRPNVGPPSRSPQLQPKLTGAPYVNGINKIDTSVSTASPDSGDEHPKFFYADRMPEATSPPPRFANGIVSSRPPLHTIFSSYQTTTSPAQRPPSPLKEEVMPISRKSSLSKPSPRRHTRLVSNGSNDIRAPEALTKGQSSISRRSSLNNPSRRISQPQSPITSSFGVSSSRRSSFALSDSGRDAATSTPQEYPSAEPPSNELTADISSDPVPSQTLNKPAPGQSKLDHLNELAANARRERKVLDLEISNSSLLAINRTLETEMRKQKAELRHLRRLRSSGGFPSSTRSGSSRFSMLSTNDDMSPASSADEDGIDDDRFSNASDGTSDDTSFPDSLSLSPTVRNSSLPVAKGRQTRSFKVDMASQRVLLLDSQRLNQALKRCLGRTDELIADGKKALEYKVDMGDAINWVPRVLTADERDGEMEPSRGLLSPGLDERIENPWDQVRSAEGPFNVPEPDSMGGQRLEIPTNPWEDEAHDESGPQSETRHESFRDKSEAESGLGILTTEHNAPGVQSIVEDRDRDMADGTPGFDDDLMAAIDTLPATDPVASLSPHIPYEDPGIDTGGDTSAIDDDGEEEATDPPPPPLTVDTSLAESSSSDDEESSTVSAKTTLPSSPGKGLGGFLRMVGGSWGV